MPLCCMYAAFKMGLELNGNRKLTYSKDLMKNSATVLTTDYGHLMRKSPSLHSRKSTPNPKFLGTAKAYFVCHIGPNFQISLIHASIGCPLSVHYRKHQLYRSTEKAFRPPGGVTILYGLHNQYISLEVHPKSATFSQIDYRPSS